MWRRPARSLTVMLKLVAGIAVAMVLGVGGVASPAQVLRANRQAAVSAASRLLGEVVLPAGATVVPREPAGDADQLERATELSGGGTGVRADATLVRRQPAAPARLPASNTSSAGGGVGGDCAP
jgi:hypothetical protein